MHKTIDLKTTAAYHRNVRRGLISTIRHALCQSIPGWVLLGLTFVGSPVLEVLTDPCLKLCVAATLKVLGTPEIKNFDIYTSANEKQPTPPIAAAETEWNLKMAIRRQKACFITCKAIMPKRDMTKS